MHRRSLLAGVARSTVAAAGGLSLAGPVLGQDDDAPPLPANPDDPVARAVLGLASDDHPSHRLRIWNRDVDPHSLALEIESGSGDVSLDGTYDLTSEDHVVVVLQERDRYTVTVTEDGSSVESTTLEPATFDQPCPATELLVLEDGAADVRTESDADHCSE
ncbi:hypothetical protein [Natronorubrum daqingense]|nr:hypothetical protein [Natronorubrum daqingense]APX95482.1 hypothetical protein BB347_01995 [Natronorubrum daqingense]